jgi:hypothetical protein
VDGLIIRVTVIDIAIGFRNRPQMDWHTGVQSHTLQVTYFSQMSLVLYSRPPALHRLAMNIWWNLSLTESHCLFWLTQFSLNAVTLSLTSLLDDMMYFLFTQVSVQAGFVIKNVVV